MGHFFFELFVFIVIYLGHVLYAIIALRVYLVFTSTQQQRGGRPLHFPRLLNGGGGGDGPHFICITFGIVRAEHAKVWVEGRGREEGRDEGGPSGIEVLFSGKGRRADSGAARAGLGEKGRKEGGREEGSGGDRSVVDDNRRKRRRKKRRGQPGQRIRHFLPISPVCNSASSATAISPMGGRSATRLTARARYSNNLSFALKLWMLG